LEALEALEAVEAVEAVATVALFDPAGTRLHAIGLARTPGSKKVALQAQLEAELRSAMERYPMPHSLWWPMPPRQNWRIIDELERSLGTTSIRCVDYFHGKDRLITGLKLSGPSRARATSGKMCCFTTRRRGQVPRGTRPPRPLQEV
jgi:hypothetical protein